jgi:hypothetical protein
MSITTSKLHQILWNLIAWNERAMVIATAGGEIALDFTSQPQRATHDYLISKGFIVSSVVNEGAYVYRPRVTRRKK